MLLHIASFVIFLLNFQEHHCMRKLIKGLPTDGVEKKYVVYLVKSQNSQKKYDAWLCGGALVSPEFVVTSAACVIDVDDIYVLAGYDTYVKEPEIFSDPCFTKNKKKVVYKCYAKEYEFDNKKVEKWTYIDIAVVKLESAYDFVSASYKPCSYVPAAITVNYDDRVQLPGRDAVVYGWGHKSKWRDPNDKKNYNQANLNYAPVVLMKKVECAKKYTEKRKEMQNVIHKYMICSEDPGGLSLTGKPLKSDIPPVFIDGCETTECMRTREMLRNLPLNATRERDFLERYLMNMTLTDSRRQGICQNDHGGPLVSWRGVDEVLIGVASAFRVNKGNQCTGPFLYTSTQCNGRFLNCILNPNAEFQRAARCDAAPALRGFDKVEKYISWRDHPDGPADNERD